MESNHKVRADAQTSATGGSGATQGVVDSVTHPPVVHANDGPIAHADGPTAHVRNEPACDEPAAQAGDG